MAILSTDSGFFASIKSGFIYKYNSHMESDAFSRRLLQLKNERGIKTQVALSKCLGFSTSIINDWLLGEKIPSIKTAIIVAVKLEVCVEWLLTGRGPKCPDNPIDLRTIVDISDLTEENRLSAAHYINYLLESQKTGKPLKELKKNEIEIKKDEKEISKVTASTFIKRPVNSYKKIKPNMNGR